MFAIFLNSFVLFFITIDIIGNLPFIISLTEGAKLKRKNQIALKSIIIAFFITIIFAYLGKYLLDAIGVSLDDKNVGYILISENSNEIKTAIDERKIFIIRTAILVAIVILVF